MAAVLAAWFDGKLNNPPTATRFDLDGFGQRPTGSDSFKDPFKLSTNKIGESDCCSQNRTAQQRLSLVAPDPIGDRAGPRKIERAAVSQLQEKVIGSR